MEKGDNLLLGESNLNSGSKIGKHVSHIRNIILIPSSHEFISRLIDCSIAV